MNDQLPLEAQLSLYGDTACRDTGQYFCNARPFSTPRFGNKVTLLSCGKDAFQSIHREMHKAKHFIWIADWQMSHDVELMRTDEAGRPYRLHQVIKDIIKSKPVHVRVLLYRSIKDTVPGTYDAQAKKKLESLNSKGYPGSVSVLLQMPTTAQLDSIDYSHHQKFVVIDGKVGFIGGIDLANGRWETPSFDVVIDPNRFVINEMYNPGATQSRGTTSHEKKWIKDFGFADPWGDTLLDEGCQPRMPWQDVHIKLEGPSVVDIHRNFVRRWNMTHKAAFWWNKNEHNEIIDKVWLKKIKAWDTLKESQQSKPGAAQVQIVRSVSNYHLNHEGTRPDDIDLYPDERERDLWKRCLPKWRTEHQNNILNAVVNCIRSADNYVYIETQFFISGFGVWGDVDSSKVGNEDNGIRNQVADELAKRIGFHIKAKTPFHVYLVVPVHPEGPTDAGAVWKQQWLALASIRHGSRSLINQIKASLIAAGRPAADWNQYLTVLNMRNFGATIQYARDPVTNDEDFSCEIGRYVVTEQIYIHSKLLIVDDAVAIVGSANTNDRSLSGNGDTEIAAVIVDTADVDLRDLGSPTMKVQTRKFARELRLQLWKKHFGFNIREDDYFNSGERARRAGRSVPDPLPNSPRTQTSEERISDFTGIAVKTILEKPCAPAVVKAIQSIAAHNRKVYERVFTHTPRGFKTFDAGQSHYREPYPLAVDIYSTYLRDRLNDPIGGTQSKSDVMAKRLERYNYQMTAIIKKTDFKGVIPPSLQPEFMTKALMPHQVAATKNINFGRRQVLYDGAMVHDIKKTMNFLKTELIGFFIEAPLQWGRATKTDGNPTKESAAGVDVAINNRRNGTLQNGATG